MTQRMNVRDYLGQFGREAEACGFCGSVLLEMEDGNIVVWERKGEGKVVYVSAGMHGDEPAGMLALLEMMREGMFVDGVHWLICPVLNPSGVARMTRDNVGGMDLNRDYLRRESAEVKAHVAWLEGVPVPDLFVSFHEDWETEGFYFYEINLGEDDVGRAECLLKAVGKFFPAEIGPEIDGHEVREDGWIYHGAEPDLPESWPEAIYLAHLGCALSFTFETPSKADLVKRVGALVAGFRALLEWELGL